MDKYILEWHKTEDKKPENDDVCIAIYENSNNMKGYYMKGYYIVVHYDGQWVCNVDYEDMGAPIYWAKLPNLN